MNIVEMTIKVPDGSQEQIKRRAVDEVKEWLIGQKTTETSAIEAEIEADFELVEEANGLGKEKEQKPD